MEVAFREFEMALENKPKLVATHIGWAYRFVEEDIYQAIIQKLARVQSSVRAAYVLLENGYVQEQAILHRIIDETNEDILFLTHATISADISPLHQRYLIEFWKEEFEHPTDPIKSEQKRKMIPRKKIRAYIAKAESKVMELSDEVGDYSRGIELGKTISKFYSGFVHGASPQIMDSYFGGPPKFHTRGMLGTPKIDDYRKDFWNPMFRSFLSHVYVAMTKLGNKELLENLLQAKNQFESNSL